MNTIKPSGGFTRGGGGRGNDRPSFGRNRDGNRGGRSFSDKPRRDDRNGGDRQTFQATCASCQKTCDVPFRPSGDKPVYCSDCFSKQRGDSRTSRPQRSNERRPSSAAPTYNDAKVEQRLTLIEGKLQRILDLLQQPKEISEKAANVVRPDIDTVGLTAVVKKVVKKAVAKKTVVKKAAKKVTKKK